MNKTPLRIARTIVPPIYLSKEAKIREALMKVNGSAHAFVIAETRDLREALADVENRLTIAGVPLPKSRRRGITFTYRPSGPWANTYRHRAVSTVVMLEWRAAGWALVGAERDDVFPRQSAKLSVALTTDAQNWILSRVAGYDTKPDLITIEKLGSPVDMAAIEARWAARECQTKNTN